jgi:hypothetical protein
MVTQKEQSTVEHKPRISSSDPWDETNPEIQGNVQNVLNLPTPLKGHYLS